MQSVKRRRGGQQNAAQREGDGRADAILAQLSDGELDHMAAVLARLIVSARSSGGRRRRGPLDLSPSERRVEAES
jgi:hypothetical protein